jgi:hypothetical protein
MALIERLMGKPTPTRSVDQFIRSLMEVNCLVDAARAQHVGMDAVTGIRAVTSCGRPRGIGPDCDQL